MTNDEEETKCYIQEMMKHMKEERARSWHILAGRLISFCSQSDLALHVCLFTS